ncbi:HAD family hydrolase [Fodinicurvata sediminis]|uniref:HAD family hydrolase n=1 Tax=Fodinicurvata sediminis TaxID=1121832 RepID=UPI0003B3D079|nr:HAD family hydrolase [Fodinicurvata sediminis]
MQRARYHVAVFDCDGVILASNRLKSQAFAQALEGEDPALVAEFVAWHQANGGIARQVKFDHFFRSMKGISAPEEPVRQAVDRYGRIVRQGLRDCALIPGVEELLPALQARNIACYVNSGGSEAELREIFAERGLAQWFRGIYGSPDDKFNNMKRAGLEDLGSGEGLLLGDSRVDREVARHYSLDFVYVAHESEWQPEPGELLAEDTLAVQDLHQIVRIFSAE